MVHTALVVGVLSVGIPHALGRPTDEPSTDSAIAAAKRSQRGVVHLIYEQQDVAADRGRKPARILAGCDASTGAWYFVTLVSAHLRTAQREHFEGAGLIHGPAMTLCKDQPAYQALHDYGPSDAIQWLELSLMEARREALSLESFDAGRGWVFRWAAFGGDPKLLAEFCPQGPPAVRERLVRLDPDGVLAGLSEWGSREIVDRPWRRLPRTGMVVNEHYRTSTMKLLHVDEAATAGPDEFTVRGLQRRIDRERAGGAQPDSTAASGSEGGRPGGGSVPSRPDAEAHEPTSSWINWTLFGTGVLVLVVGVIAYVRRG